MMFRKATIEDVLKDDPLRDFAVWWNRVTQDDIDEMQRIIQNASNERSIQTFLEKRPYMLVQHLGGGNGRWCIPQKRLGAELIPDFIIGESSSIGHEWFGVELESPRFPLFNKNGDPAKALVHALRQVADWRSWLRSNIDYACRPLDQNGLGLTDIDGNIRCLILIGRRNEISPNTNNRRRQMCQDQNVEIHSYDWLIEVAQRRVDGCKSSKQ